MFAPECNFDGVDDARSRHRSAIRDRRQQRFDGRQRGGGGDEDAE